MMNGTGRRVHLTQPYLHYPNWGMLIDEDAIVTCEPPSLKRLLQYELTTNVPHQTDLSTGPIFQSSMWKAIMWCVKRAILTKNKRMMMEQSWQIYATSSCTTTEKKSYFGVTTHISVCPRSSKWAGAQLGDWLQLWVSALGTIFTTPRRKNLILYFAMKNIWDGSEGMTTSW